MNKRGSSVKTDASFFSPFFFIEQVSIHNNNSRIQIFLKLATGILFCIYIMFSDHTIPYPYHTISYTMYRDTWIGVREKKNMPPIHPDENLLCCGKYRSD